VRPPGQVHAHPPTVTLRVRATVTDWACATSSAWSPFTSVVRFGELVDEALARAVGSFAQQSARAEAPPPSRTRRPWAWEGWVRLEVHNAGEPIPAELLPTLFEPFASARAGRRGSREGLGLGLSIAREIAQAHGGRIEVESRKGEGTTSDVLLSRLLPAPSPISAAPAATVH
jgi:signal transduction histidine kinase